MFTPIGIAVDAAGEIYVSNDPGPFAGVNKIAVFAAGANGDVAPISVITGSATALSGNAGLAVR